MASFFLIQYDNNLFMLFLLFRFFFCFVFEGLAMQPRLTLNSQSLYLGLQSAEITGMCHQSSQGENRRAQKWCLSVILIGIFLEKEVGQVFIFKGYLYVFFGKFSVFGPYFFDFLRLVYRKISLWLLQAYFLTLSFVL